MIEFKWDDEAKWMTLDWTDGNRKTEFYCNTHDEARELFSLIEKVHAGPELADREARKMADRMNELIAAVTMTTSSMDLGPTEVIYSADPAEPAFCLTGDPIGLAK